MTQKRGVGPMTVPPWRPFFQTLVEPLFQTPPGNPSVLISSTNGVAMLWTSPPSGTPLGPRIGSGGLAKVLTLIHQTTKREASEFSLVQRINL